MEFNDFIERVWVERCHSDVEAERLFRELSEENQVITAFVAPEGPKLNAMNRSIDEATLRAIWQDCAPRLEDGDFVGTYFFKSADTALRGLAIYRKPSVNS